MNRHARIPRNGEAVVSGGHRDEGRLFVRGVPPHISQVDLMNAFNRYGTVNDVHNSGRGYAFVNFTRKYDADSAREQLTGQRMFGSVVQIEPVHRSRGGHRHNHVNGPERRDGWSDNSSPRSPNFRRRQAIGDRHAGVDDDLPSRNQYHGPDLRPPELPREGRLSESGQRGNNTWRRPQSEQRRHYRRRQSSQGVTRHGGAINIFPDLQEFGVLGRCD